MRHQDNSAAIGMQLERISGADARTHVFSPAGWAPLRLRSSVPLPNGSYLNAVQYPAGAYEWGRVLAYSLPVTTLPVLLIGTSNDKLVSMDAIEAAARRLPQAELVRFGEEAHHEVLREVDAVRGPIMARIADFLDRAAPSGSSAR